MADIFDQVKQAQQSAPPASAISPSGGGDIFAQVAAEQKAAPPQSQNDKIKADFASIPKSDTYSDRSVVERFKGGAKEVMRQAANLASVVGADKVAPSAVDWVKKKSTPSNKQQKEGMKATEVASYLIPIPGLGELEAGANASRATRVAYGATRGAIDATARTAAQTGDRSDLPGAAVLGAATGGALGGLGGKSKAILESKLGPTEKAAIAEAEKRGIRMSAGQKTGGKVTQAIEQKMQYIPGAAGPSQKFFNAQREAVAGEFNKIPNESASYSHGPSTRTPGGVSATANPATDATGAGEAVVGKVKDRMTQLKSFADNGYSSIRKQLQYHQDVVQPKRFAAEEQKYQKDLAKYMADVNSAPPGTKLTAPVAPVQPKFAAEAQMEPIRNSLKPLRDELAANLPETQRASSPGWTVLNRIVEGKENVMDAMALDKDISTVKSFLRKNQGSYLSDSSKRYATKTIGAMEQQLESSLNEVNPALVGKLKQARMAVKELHRTDDLISKLVPPGMSPINAYNKLTATGGKDLPAIQQIKRIAPNALKTVGQTYLSGLAEKATSEGGLTKTATILNKWKTLDPRVKREIFGKATSEGLDRFFLAAKRLNLDTNPSGTGKWEAVKKYGGISTAVATLLTGHPGLFAAEAGGAAAMKGLAGLMFNPKGVALLTKAISLPVGSYAQQRAFIALEVAGRKYAQGGDDNANVQTDTPPSQGIPASTGNRQSGAGSSPTPP